ncbi:MAG: AI-2E family transporter [Bacillota bacterium]
MKNRIRVMTRWERIAAAVTGGMLVLLVLIWIIKVRQSLFIVLTPFLVSLILAYLLAPLVHFMERRHISRVVAIMVLYLLFAIIIFIFCVRGVPLLLDDIQELGERLPEYAENLQDFTQHLQEDYRRFNLPPNVREIIDNNISDLEGILADQLKHAYNFLIDLFGRVLLFLLVPILTYYFLKDEILIKNNLRRLFPRGIRQRLVSLSSDIDKALGAFIRGALVVSLLVGVISYFGLLLLDVSFPLVMAMIIGITNMIPYIGPIIGAVPALLVALLDSPLLFFKVLLLIFIVQQVESHLVGPYIIGKSISLHPMLVILVLLLGGKLFGFTGLILAVPATIVIRIIGRHLLAYASSAR